MQNSIVNVPSLTPTKVPLPTQNSIFTKNDLSNEDVFARLNFLIDKEAVISSHFINEYNGKIVKLENKDIVSPFKGNPDYQPELSILLETVNNSNKFSYTLYFDKEELSFLNVKKQNGDSSNVTYQDLKEGQNIVVQETWDLIKKKISDYKITIL